MGRISLFRARKGPTGYRGRAFTLIQLLVVVAVIGYLAAFDAPRYSDQSSARIAEAQITSLQHARDQFPGTRAAG